MQFCIEILSSDFLNPPDDLPEIPPKNISEIPSEVPFEIFQRIPSNSFFENSSGIRTFLQDLSEIPAVSSRISAKVEFIL